ncbi:MAG: glycosyltransferase [Phycisphaerales bacterium]
MPPSLEQQHHAEQAPTPQAGGDPLRIAVVCGKFPAFSETFISEMAARLLARGHDVRVMASRRGGGALHPEVQRWNLLDRTRYRPRRSEWWRGGLPKVLAAAARHPHAAFASGVGLRGLFSAVPWLDEPAFDCAVCHFGPNAATVCRLRRAGVIDRATGVVAIFHGIDVIASTDADLKELEREADEICAVSHFLRDRLIERGMPGERIRIQRMGTDLARFPSSPTPIRSVDEPLHIVFVGRLIKYKACDDLINAIALLPPDLRDRVTLSVLGDGDERSALESLTASQGLEKVVRFFGAVPQSQVQETLQRSHALVIPSVTIPGQRFEGLGLVAAEAMAAGRCVIGSNDGGIPEMIRHDETGLLFEPGDATALARAIERLCREPDLAPRLGAAARAGMEGGEFDADVAIEALIDRCRRLMGERGRKPG